MSNKTDIAALLPDNTTGEITPTKVREAFDKVDPEQQPIPQSVDVAGKNPTVHLKPDAGSSAAQMQVIYNGHDVASMEWLKATQEFIFNLADKDSGVVKATFEIKSNGKAYIDSEQIATINDVSGSAGGLFQFDYKLKIGTVDATPAAHIISFDNIDPKLATKMYFNKKDRHNSDMSLFLKAISSGDWINLHDNNNINDFIAFDVSGAAVQSGDIFEVPVSHYDDNGTLTDGERVFVHWQRDEEVITTITDINNIKKEGVYDGNNVANSPITGDIVVVATKDSKGNIGLTLKDNTMRVYQGGIPKGGTANFISVAADHLFGTTDPLDTLGHNGDIYFKVV